MLHFGYRARKEEDENKQEREEGWKTCRSSDFCSPDWIQLGKPLTEPDCSRVSSTKKGRETQALPWPFHHRGRKTWRYIHNFPRLGFMRTPGLSTRRGQVHRTQPEGWRPPEEWDFLSTRSLNHFRRFFPRGYPPPWLVCDQTITFHRVLNNEKRWVFLFCCRRTHPSGWLCPVWPHRERPSRLTGPASLPALTVALVGRNVSRLRQGGQSERPQCPTEYCIYGMYGGPYSPV